MLPYLFLINGGDWKMIELNKIYNEDCLEGMKRIEDKSIHAVVSDIPYGINYSDWDVLHDNTNSALGGSSPAQKSSNESFSRRGKPINGWSKKDRNISLEYEEWFEDIAKEYSRILVEGSSIFIFAGRRYSHRIINAMEHSGFSFRDMIAWEKSNARLKAQRVSKVFDRRGDIENAERFEGWRLGNLRPLFEPILWFQKPYKIGGTLTDNILENGVGGFNIDEWNKHNSESSNIIRISASKNDTGLHETQKPVKLMESLVTLCTQENQTVLDNFMGSGTTAIACLNTGRNFIGFEIDETYCNLANTRISEHLEATK